MKMHGVKVHDILNVANQMKCIKLYYQIFKNAINMTCFMRRVPSLLVIISVLLETTYLFSFGDTVHPCINGKIK